MIAPFVDVGWLRAHRDDVVLVDVRFYLDGRSGREAYDRGHLPGAVYVDLEEALTGKASAVDGRHPLPDPEVFAEGMRAAGVSDGSTVVGYDDAGGVIAARLVWMLRATGHSAAVLDGGLAAWDGPLSTQAATAGRGSFTATAWPAERLATIDDAATAKRLVDARPAERFRGEVADVDPRVGHIPGAKSLPCRDNLGDDGRLVDAAELRRRAEATGLAPDEEFVSYCGSGVTACHNLLSLELAGFGRGRLYPGSWSQWSATDRPAAVGP